MERHKLYEEYFESVYARSNSLTKDEYENAFKDFERLYGKILNSRNGNKVLDIGCGTGHCLYYLEKKGLKDFIGIDISVQQVEFCKRNITKKVKRADIFEYLIDKNNIFNFILANDFLEHLKSERVCEFLELVFYSLEKEGIFKLRVPNMNNPFSLISMYRDFTHNCGFTETSIYQVLYNVGFKDIQILSPSIIKNSIKKRIRRNIVNLLHMLLRFLYYIQDFSAPNYLEKNLIVICKK